MTDILRINAEQDAVARMPVLGNYQLTLTPADLNSELEMSLLLSAGGYVEFHDQAGHLVGEISATHMTVLSSSTLSYEPGTGPLGDCHSIWAGESVLPHTHACRHTHGHANLHDLPHECGCGATLPVYEPGNMDRPAI